MTFHFQSAAAERAGAEPKHRRYVEPETPKNSAGGDSEAETALRSASTGPSTWAKHATKRCFPAVKNVKEIQNIGLYDSFHHCHQ